MILLTNDDGIYSPGLAASARALHGLGDILIAAPQQQQSGAGRSLAGAGTVSKVELDLGFDLAGAFAVEGTPALAVRTAIMALADKQVSLVVSGINYGENIGIGITVSGTLGAAIEGAAFGVPALAVSLETDVIHHYTISDEVSFSCAADITLRAATHILEQGLPRGVEIIKIDVPNDAHPDTPWRLTNLSRLFYYESTLVADRNGQLQVQGYTRTERFDELEPESDAYALLVERAVSVSPLTIDLSARAALDGSFSWQPL
ncbi:MAG: 5'/3'-nucleotidase SurE [Chloroflexi bacterium]|nr:5'/3'-nucleotidase SurE [Chloroflexota bacterium]